MLILVKVSPIFLQRLTFSLYLQAIFFDGLVYVPTDYKFPKFGPKKSILQLICNAYITSRLKSMVHNARKSFPKKKKRMKCVMSCGMQPMFSRHPEIIV